MNLDTLIIYSGSGLIFVILFLIGFYLITKINEAQLKNNLLKLKIKETKAILPGKILAKNLKWKSKCFKLKTYQE